MNHEVQNDYQKWYAIIGDNGFCYTTSDVDIVNALKVLHRVTIIELQNQDLARDYSYCAYAGRWFMRNSWMGKGIQLPLNLPPEYLFVDPEFEAREGGRNLPYFPGLLL